MNLDFTEKYTLENDFVLLRPLEPSDFDLLLEYAENEAEIWSYNSGGPAGKEGLQKYLDNAINQRTHENEYPFIVFDKATQKYVGSTRFYAIYPNNKTLEIGYTWYGKQYQGTGINKNCKYLLLEFAFEQLQMERVGFRANSLNNRSIAAMKSIGCIEEGILRNFATDAKGNRMDAIVLSIIRNEWFDTVKQKLKDKIAK